MKQLLLLVTLASCATLALAVNEFSPRGENRLMRQESRVERRELRQSEQAPFAVMINDALLTGGETEKEPKWTATIGVAYSDGEDDSKTLSTPFLLDRPLGDGESVRLSGDGWNRVRPDGADTKKGFADVSILYRFGLLKSKAEKGPDGKPKGDKWAWRGDAGIVVPTGGDIGSSDGKQRIGTSFKYEHDKWTGSVGARLTRLSGPIAENRSRNGRSGLASLEYSVAKDTAISAELSRSYRPGARGSTELSAGYEWPFVMLDRKFSGSVGLSRGLTKGSRDNAVEFSLTFGF